MSGFFTPHVIQIIRIISPINILLGIIGNSLNIIVLTRSNLRNYASTHYFLALAVNYLFISSFVLTDDLLSDGYQINLSTYSLFSCKIITYFTTLVSLSSPYFIVLTLIDRYYISSPNPNRRKLSTIKKAKWMIIFVMILFGIFCINTPILIDINNDDGFGCYIRPKTVYHQIYSILQVFIYGMITPFLMIIFGSLTIHNTKQTHVHPVHIPLHRRTERQLNLMLLIQVGTYIILNLPICIMYIILRFIPVTYITPDFVIIIIILRFLYQFSYTTPFLLYILSGQIFRKELILFIKHIFGHRGVNQVHPFVTQTNEDGLSALNQIYKMRSTKQ